MEFKGMKRVMKVFFKKIKENEKIEKVYLIGN